MFKMMFIKFNNGCFQSSKILWGFWLPFVFFYLSGLNFSKPECILFRKIAVIMLMWISLTQPNNHKRRGVEYVGTWEVSGLPLRFAAGFYLKAWTTFWWILKITSPDVLLLNLCKFQNMGMIYQTTHIEVQEIECTRIISPLTGLPSSNSGINRDLVRCEESWPHPRHTESESVF